MTPYYIFMDIDRTLIDHNQQADPRTLEAIRRYQAAGNQFFIATGRLLRSAKAVAASLQLDLNFISSNGAVTSSDGQVERTLLGPDALKQIYQVAHQLQAPTFFFSLNNITYVDQMDGVSGKDGQTRVGGLDPASYVQAASATDLLQHQDQIVNAITIVSADPATLKLAKARLEQIPEISTSSSFPTNVEITPRSVSKASAIKHFCQKRGIPLDHTIAFGDGLNDLAMLKAVGHGVAMANAVPEVLQTIPDHTTACDDNGIGSWLDQFFAKQPV